MASLLNLPLELRDQIWAYLSSARDKSLLDLSHPAKAERLDALRSLDALTRTCMQLKAEVANFLYDTVYLELTHPNQTLQWLTDIGPTNSSSIRRLVLKFKILGLCASKDTETNEYAWTLAMRSMPKLQDLTFQLERDADVAPTAGPSKDSFSSDSSLLESLAASAFACSSISTSQEPKMRNSWNSWLDYRPLLRSHSFTQALLSLGEPLPSPLVRQVNQVLSLPFAVSSAPVRLTTPLDKYSMEKNMTGLTAAFYLGHGFSLTNTCVFHENSDKTDAFLTFSRLAVQDLPPRNFLQDMLHELPKLGYLRVGSPRLDSSFLVHVPKHVHTLDVAFTDDDPNTIAENLMTMRGICKKLFTLAIAVSPLHDRDHEGEDPKYEVFFERKAVAPATAEKWQPFWNAVDEIKASRVKTWEGEGPGFKRGRSA
ncbi:uncharacterized protein KY384_004149 [Bacidia gigantensis]|uniref:uncharacterized protein n=1 Tax=Bacidia gigantensis TaxID=2732470 RepID=UPI001D0477E3|nr:uncharacterized protein KY384_004149 [Bacidia gigantensis]KAG8530792.1 hypothetical protein KY384_004149 [Bacidia gigantensis]